MTNRETILCNGIIHAASLAAGGVGAGLAQLPGSDNLVITPIQVSMTVSLGKVFGIKMSKSMAEATAASAMAAMAGRTASQVLVGWIPGVGNTINAITAGTITEIIGWTLAEEFSVQTAEA